MGEIWLFLYFVCVEVEGKGGVYKYNDPFII